MGFHLSKILLIAVLAAVLAPRLSLGQDYKGSKFPMATDDRVKGAGWWATKRTASSAEYAGAASCAKCHAEISASQRNNAMFNAASKPSDSKSLDQNSQMRFWDERYSYLLSHEPNETKIIVKDETNTVSATVGWIFGADKRDQTYILKHNDQLLESRLSYYPSLPGLGITVGHDTQAPKTIAEALGSPLDADTAPRCFGCHTTASMVSGKFDPDHATLGVTCEACHGPGFAHVASMESSSPPEAAGTIFNPRHLAPVDSVDFCGACHRTPVDVAVFMSPHLGIASIRFQPYRLQRSLCWGAHGDPRITCMACHDPHKPVAQDAVAYDDKCLKCHNALGRPVSAKLAPACPIATEECASCHMPKYDLPKVHKAFTDHLIQIVREGGGFRE